jgi:hypothetical protein
MEDRDRISILPDRQGGKPWERCAERARKARADVAGMKNDQDEGLPERLFIPVLFAVMLAPLQGPAVDSARPASIPARGFLRTSTGVSMKESLAD